MKHKLQLLSLLLISSLLFGACIKEPKVINVNFDSYAEGDNPYIFGICSSSYNNGDVSFSVNLTMGYTGEYDSAAIFLNDEKWTDVNAFPYNKSFSSKQSGTYDFRGVVYWGDSTLNCRYYISAQFE